MTDRLSRLLKGESIMVGGHRGLSLAYPENTLPAVKAALALGVDLIEIDIYLTRDGVPVLAHDARLERCSNGEGPIGSYTLKELKQLDFGLYKGERFRGTPVPTLADFFACMQAHPDVLIDVDVKPSDRGIECAQKAVETAARMHMLDRCVFNSIDCDIVHTLHGLVGRRIVGAPDFFPDIRHFREGPGGTFSELWGVCVPLKDLTPEVAERFRGFGLTVVCTPADTPAQVAHALACGTKLLLSNDPAVPLRMLGRLNADGTERN